MKREEMKRKILEEGIVPADEAKEEAEAEKEEKPAEEEEKEDLCTCF